MSAVTALRIVAGIAIVLTLVLLLVGVAGATGCGRPYTHPHDDGAAESRDTAERQPPPRRARPRAIERHIRDGGVVRTQP